MESKKINYTLVGAFVVLMVAALLGTIAVLTGRTGATDTYTTTYDNVSGIKFGTQVLYEGFPVGQVETIEPVHGTDSRMSFQVVMSITEGWKIPEDSEATKASAGLLAAMSIDINAGESQTFLSPGDQIPAGVSADMFAAISEVAGEVGSLTRHGILPLVKDIRGVVSNVKTTLTFVDTLVKEGGPKIVSNIQKVTETAATDTPGLFANLDQFTQRLNTTMDRADALLSDELTEDIHVSADNARRISQEALALTTELKSIDDDLRKTLKSLDDTITGNRTEIDDSLDDLRYTLGTVARHVGTITRNMEGTSRNMLEFSRQIRENPGLLISGTQPREQ